MKATIEVTDRKEAEAIRAGLNEPAVRAFVIVMGALSRLPTSRARRRVMEYVADYFDENSDEKRSSDEVIPDSA
jgi:hypothetical protein